MGFKADLRRAIEKYAGTPESADDVSFQLAPAGGFVCCVRGIVGTGKTPRLAFKEAMRGWADVGHSIAEDRREELKVMLDAALPKARGKRTGR